MLNITCAEREYSSERRGIKVRKSSRGGEPGGGSEKAERVEEMPSRIMGTKAKGQTVPPVWPGP